MARLPGTENSFPDGYTYAHAISYIPFCDRSDSAGQRMQSPATALRTAAAGYATAVAAAAATADGASVRTTLGGDNDRVNFISPGG
jgi:hypothetical protein